MLWIYFVKIARISVGIRPYRPLLVNKRTSLSEVLLYFTQCGWWTQGELNPSIRSIRPYCHQRLSPRFIEATFQLRESFYQKNMKFF